MAVESWEASFGQGCFGSHTSLLDVSILDSKRDSRTNEVDLFQIPLEWKEGRTGDSLGKLEEDSCPKRTWGMGP